MSKELDFWPISWTTDAIGRDLRDLDPIKTKLWNKEPLTTMDDFVLKSRLQSLETLQRMLSTDVDRLVMQQEANIPRWKKFFRI